MFVNAAGMVRLAYLGSALAFLPSLSCSPTPTTAGTIELVVPKGFRGPLLLIEDRISGVDPVVSGSKTTTFNFPASGKIFVRSLTGFETWHKTTLLFVNNQGAASTLDTSSSVRQNGSDNQLWGGVGGSYGGVNYVYFFVGNEREYLHYREQVPHVDAMPQSRK